MTTVRSKSESARWMLLAAAILSLALPFIPGAALVTYPLSLFRTYFHEGGHAVMTLLTGGSVEFVRIAQDTSGVTGSRGGFYPLICSAGYIGATAFGLAFLLLNRRPGSGKRTLVLMAAFLLLITGLWIRVWSNPFGFVMGLLFAGTLVAAAHYVPEEWAAFLAAFLAVQLCLNALIDVRDLLWMTTHIHADNDAVFMARAMGLPAWFWALLWGAISLAISAAAIRMYWRDSK